MGFEHIAMQAYNGKDTATLSNKFTNVLIAGVVEAALRQNDSHTTARFKEVQVTLDKQHITANLILPFAGTVFAKLIMRNNCVFLDITSKRRICHHEVKLELAIILHTSRLKLFQFLKALVIGINPIFLLSSLAPTGIVQCIQMKHVSLTVTGDQVQRASNTNGFFIKVNGKDIVSDKIGLFRNALCGSESITFGKAFSSADIFPNLENTMDCEARTAAGGVDDFVLVPSRFMRKIVCRLRLNEVSRQ